MSSIFDALKKLEDEKSTRESPKAGGKLLRTPPPGGRRRGLFPWLIVALVMIVGGAIYLTGREGEEPVTEAPATLAERVLAGAGEREAGAGDPVPAPPALLAPPVAGPPADVSSGAPAVAPTAPVMSEEQKRAREQLLARIAKFRNQSAVMKGEEGEGVPAATATGPVSAPPREPVRLAPVVPERLAPVAEAPASPAQAGTEADLPDVPDSAAGPQAEPWREVPEAPEPEPPPPVVKRQVPMMMVTEVTYHPQPELRTARIRIEGDDAHLVREGDRYRGLKVKEITSGAITVDVAGTEVSVDVGDSLSFTVSEPDFH